MFTVRAETKRGLGCLARTALAATLTLAALAPASVLAQGKSLSAEDARRAQELFDEGKRFFDKKEFAVACTAFEQSQTIDPQIGTQLNIARCYQEWGKEAAAYKAFIEASRLAKAANDKRAEKLAPIIADLSTRVPRLTIGVNTNADPAAVIVIDGKEQPKTQLVDILLDAGSHAIEVRAPGREPAKTEITLSRGEKTRIDLDIPAAKTRIEKVVFTERASKGKLIAGWGLTGLGAIAFGTAGYISLVARQDYRNAFKGNCDSKTNECNATGLAGTSDARKRANVASIVAGSGAVLVGAGVFVLLTARRQKRTQEKAALYWTPQIDAASAGLAVGGTF